MRFPARPPRWMEHLQQVLGDETKAQDVLFSEGPTVNGRYVHWDKLRRLPQRPGWKAEDRWVQLKLARTKLYREIPLRSTGGDSFKFAVPDEAARQLHLLDRDAGSQILISEDVVNADSRRRYVISSLMEEAITSSQIEGAATTRRVAKEMLRTGRLPRDHGERMILNNYKAMQRISLLAKEPLTPEVVFELHRILGEEALDVPDGIGRFRRPDERIGVYDTTENELLHDPPKAEDLPARMVAMCDFANGKTPELFVHPVIRAIVLHFWLAYDHPFVDGNGRCARALFYWSMLRSNYWMTEYLSISSVINREKAQYGRAYLYVETDDFDLTYFVLYHLEVIRKAMQDLKQHLKRKMDEVRETERLLRRSEEQYNHRQMVLLAHAMRHPDAVYTIDSHKASHGVVYQTARTDLLDLAKKGLLEKRQRGKEFVFAVVQDLARRIEDGPGGDTLR